MINIKENERLNMMNHSCAHLLAQAVKHLYPEAKFWVGPVIEEDERNSENKLTCTSDIYTLDYKYQEQDDYSIKITYDSKDKNQNTWSEEYSELVDFIDIKIESWQLTEENTNERKA